MIVPQNLYTTISSKSFITYMGLGECDLRIDLQQVADIPKKASTLKKAMDEDPAIASSAVFYTKSFALKDLDESVKVELGNHTLFPVSYIKGTAPVSETEIALSSIQATELDKKVGDTLVLIDGNREKVLRVCGIYSDITNGGKTAKATFPSDLDSVLWSVIVASLHDQNRISEVVERYSSSYAYAKVSGIAGYIEQTFGSTKDSIKKAALASIAVALSVSALLVALFIKMLLAKDRYPIAVMKALGFTDFDISIQYVSRSLLVLALAIVLGTLLANTLGEFFAGAIIASLGATAFSFVVKPLTAYLVSPLLLLCAVLLATVFTSFGSKAITISDNIKE
jgi:putative ABC transport system permease protein